MVAMTTQQISGTAPRRPLDTFANRLRLIRNEMDWSVEEACAATGIGRGSWAGWEKGSQPRNFVANARRIALATGYDLDWIVYGGELSQGEGPGGPDRGGQEFSMHTRRKPSRIPTAMSVFTSDIAAQTTPATPATFRDGLGCAA